MKQVDEEVSNRTVCELLQALFGLLPFEVDHNTNKKEILTSLTQPLYHLNSKGYGPTEHVSILVLVLDSFG